MVPLKLEEGGVLDIPLEDDGLNHELSAFLRGKDASLEQLLQNPSLSKERVIADVLKYKALGARDSVYSEFAFRGIQTRRSSDLFPDRPNWKLHQVLDYAVCVSITSGRVEKLRLFTEAAIQLHGDVVRQYILIKDSFAYLKLVGNELPERFRPPPYRNNICATGCSR